MTPSLSTNVESASHTMATTAETVMRLAPSCGFSSTRMTAVIIWPMTVSGRSTEKVRTPATVSAMMSGVAPKKAQIGSVNTAMTTARTTETMAVSQKPWLKARLAPRVSPAPSRLPTTAGTPVPNRLPNARLMYSTDMMIETHARPWAPRPQPMTRPSSTTMMIWASMPWPVMTVYLRTRPGIGSVANSRSSADCAAAVSSAICLPFPMGVCKGKRTPLFATPAPGTEFKCRARARANCVGVGACGGEAL